MKNSILGAYFFGAAVLALSAVSAGAQGTNYPGQCSSYSLASECRKCCGTFHKSSYLSKECTNSCQIANIRDSEAKMTPVPPKQKLKMTPKPKQSSSPKSH